MDIETMPTGPRLARRALTTTLLMFVAAGGARAAPETAYRPEFSPPPRTPESRS